MNLPVYPFRRTCENEYQFISIGKNGSISKTIWFERMAVSWKIYNLAFGDWDEESQKLNDLTVSDNDDRQMILATVASTIIDFTNRNRGSTIYAEGSTRSRTRLYQMGIAAYLAEIEKLFLIMGYINDDWEQFQFGRNYHAFLLRCK